MHEEIKNRATAFDIIYTGSRQSTPCVFLAAKNQLKIVQLFLSQHTLGFPSSRGRSKLHIYLNEFFCLQTKLYHQTELHIDKNDWPETMSKINARTLPKTSRSLYKVLMLHRFKEPWNNIKDTRTQMFHMKTSHNILNRLKDLRPSFSTPAANKKTLVMSIGNPATVSWRLKTTLKICGIPTKNNLN